MSTLLFLLALAAPTDARPASPLATAAHGPRAGRVHVDVADDGAVWVRGATYKARIGADGATYFPFLGSRAPRSWPLGLRFAGAESGGVEVDLPPASAPIVDGDRVIVDRGPVDEVWILRPDSIEQTFVVERRLGGGALALLVDVRTELEGRAASGGFEFAGPDGGARYSEAFVVRDGGRVPVRSALDGGALRIEVPETEAARGALVVDPVITTFGVETTTADTFNADIAWDQDAQRALVVMEEVFSATDHDVYTELLDATGAQIASAYVDTSAEDWRDPRCANLPHADQFLVVASVGGWGAVPVDVIAGRASAVATLAYGPKFLVDGGAANPKLAPDLGSDSRNAPDARYCVVYTRDLGATRETVWRTIDRTGVIGAASTFPGASDDSRAVISSSTNDQRWVVADTGGAPGSNDVYAWSVDFTGAQVGGTNVVNAATGDITQLGASTPRDDGTSLLAWRLDDGVDEDVIVAYVDASMIVVDRRSLAALEGAGNQGEDQRHVALEADGERFVAIYAESVGGSATNFDVRISTLHVLDAALGVSEAHVAVPGSTLGDLRPQIVSAYGAGGQNGLFAFVWDRDSALFERNVHAGSYVVLPGGPIESYCSGDTTGTACPCGNVGDPGRGCPNSAVASGALLIATGFADLSADTLFLGASDMPGNTSCLFFQGTTATAGGGGSVFGDGLRCASGSVIRLATKTASGGAAAFPAVGDPTVSVRGQLPATGGTRFYQCWYRNAFSFCTASTFNTTNGVEVTWLP